MGRIDVFLPDNLEKKFRKEISNRLGFKKGNITKAIIEAIEDWIKKK